MSSRLTKSTGPSSRSTCTRYGWATRMTRMIQDFFFFFQAEDGIRDTSVTGVQTCALPIFPATGEPNPNEKRPGTDQFSLTLERELSRNFAVRLTGVYIRTFNENRYLNVRRPPSAYNIPIKIGRASCREREQNSVDELGLKK